MNSTLFTHMMNRDLLVNLYDDFLKSKSDDTIDVRRILSPDIYHLESFIQTHFSLGWDSEIKAGCYKVNPTVFIAIKDGEIVGFAGYDCTAKGYFGPTGVHPKFQGQGIGRALLLKTLFAMKEDGYGYAIIGGGEGKFSFYKKVAHASIIDASSSIYQRMIK